ncbi:MAG: amidohydrolase [Tenericutes bacterium]|jgi:predicted amidohydrolase YtcJ|nr:amidohydrolase [Mycoplasmatota bacterium]
MRLPGFIDGHLHVLGVGYYQTIVDLSSAHSIQEVIRILSSKKDEKIIIGRGWNQDQFSENRMINKTDLNQISTTIPIVITRVCGHVLVTNDKMLTMAGINESTSQVLGGSFDFSTGIFNEKAMSLIHKKMPKLTKEDIKKFLLLANKTLIKNGITSVASDDFSSFNVDYELVIETIKEMYEENKIQVKITQQVNLPYEKLQDFLKKGYANKRIHPKFKMGPLKILADGSLGGRTAAMIAPYSDDINNYGIKSFSDNELFKMMSLADEYGMDSVVHAIGDATSLQVIKTLEKVIAQSNRKNHNHAIIHAQLTTKSQIELMEKLNIGAIVQPIFMNTDIKIIESRLGDRINNIYLYKTMYEHINLGFSTDAPIEPVNPFYNIYTAMTNRSIKYPFLDSFNSDECFSLQESLNAYTVNNLPYVYEDALNEDDYIIINRDLDPDDPESIRDALVLKTVIDGEEVFSLK